MRAVGILPFTPMQVFRCLSDSRYRVIYDENIDISRIESKFAANSYHIYQKSKAMFMVSSRDFVIT